MLVLGWPPALSNALGTAPEYRRDPKCSKSHLRHSGTTVEIPPDLKLPHRKELIWKSKRLPPTHVVFAFPAGARESLYH